MPYSESEISNWKLFVIFSLENDSFIDLEHLPKF